MIYTNLVQRLVLLECFRWIAMSVVVTPFLSATVGRGTIFGPDFATSL